MSSSRPTPFRSSVAGVVYLAETAADEFSSAATVFSPGEQTATELVFLLRSYQQFHAALDNNSPSSQADFESSLTANLRPCHDALQAMLDMRRNYGSDKNLGLRDRGRWMLDEKQFMQHAASLRQDTARLRELIQQLQRLAAVGSTSTHPGSTTALPPQTIIPIGQVPYAAPPPQQPPIASTGRSPPTRRYPQPQTQSQDAKPTMMCPNGSGCRAPLCHKTYRHPDAPKCANGKNCGVKNCDNWHPKSALCPAGPSCPMVGCDKAHPWPRDPPPQANSPPAWCELRFGCPGGYNGVCPKKHPRRAPCRDFNERGHCARGASCTFQHGVETASRQGGEQYIAELPAS